MIGRQIRAEIGRRTGGHGCHAVLHLDLRRAAADAAQRDRAVVTT